VNFAALSWQHAWLSSVRETVRTRHHAWMIVGRDGDGLADAGAALAASLLCETPKNDLACGQCGSCRWLVGGVHPDFVRLAPEESDDDVARLPTIKTDAARAAISFMELSASTQRGRVLLVDPATALSRESANALLKAIEEPGKVVANYSFACAAIESQSSG
jgi:DNA polymerase III subunit delta'